MTKKGDLVFTDEGVLLSASDSGEVVRFDLHLHERYAAVALPGPGVVVADGERWTRLGRSAALLGDWQRAAEFLGYAAAEGATVSHLELARALWAVGRVEEARGALRKAGEAGEVSDATVEIWLAAALELAE